MRTEKKNQHYVPKLYLKFFSENQKLVGLFNISQEKYIARVPLKHQAKEDFFYGEDGFIEEWLSKLEGDAAPSLRSIILNNKLPSHESQDYLKVLIFTVIMANRTKDSAEKVKEITDKLVRELMSYDEDLKNIVDNVRVYPENPAAMVMDTTIRRIDLALDLKVKLLRNRTSTKFITSDHPVCKYNQYLEQRKHPGGHYGITAKGLQLFFPISPDHLLCFYDEWAYKIGSKNQTVIDIANKEDVDKLNHLQVINCLENLFFSKEISEHYIRQIYNKAVTKRLPEYTTLNKANSYIDKDGLEHISYHSFGNNLGIKLDLSFIKQTKKAKQHILSDFYAQVRNEKMRERRD